MSYQLLAFFMGLLGSLHCAAMCGPLVLALPVGRRSQWRAFLNKLVYQVGRVLTYILLGLLIASIGNALSFRGWQQGVSIGTGVLLLIAGTFMLAGRYSTLLVGVQQRLLAPLVKRMGYWLYRPGGNLIAGMVNGLLPCGMVYLALAGSLSANSVMNGGLFMLFFGLGTLPMMLSISIFGNFIRRYVRFNMAKWLPAMFVVMGCWFLLRGANLDIAYLSPLIYPEGALTCN